MANILVVFVTWFKSLFSWVTLKSVLKGALIAGAGAALAYLGRNLTVFHLTPLQMTVAAAIISALINWLQKTTVVAGAALKAAGFGAKK